MTFRFKRTRSRCRSLPPSAKRGRIERARSLHQRPSSQEESFTTVRGRRGGDEREREESSSLVLSTLVLPPVLLYHVRQLDDVLALLVLLARLEGLQGITESTLRTPYLTFSRLLVVETPYLLVLPPECGLAAVAVYVGDRVQARQQDPLLRRAAADVHHGVEQVGAALAPLRKGKGNMMVKKQVIV